MCICQTGYTGQDCSTRIDICQSSSLCQHGAQCISRSDALGYECRCQPGFTGRNCQHIDICHLNRPCKHGSTCVNLVDIDASIYPKYSCKCALGYTGVNCEIKQDCEGEECEEETTTTRRVKLLKKSNTYEVKTVPTTTTSTTTTSTTTEETTIESNSQNGSFVLVLNIDVDEFHRRKAEIITEFERRFGILMLIKKDPNTSKEMIYPYHPK